MKSFIRAWRVASSPYSNSLRFLALSVLVSSGCGRSPQTYLERGNRFADAGKYDDAVIEYRNAVQRDPRLGEAYYRLGLAELKKNLPVDAQDALGHAAELMPDNEQVLASLGDLSLRLYDADPRRPPLFYGQAEKAADRLLRRNPGGFDGNRLKGALALIDRKPDYAIDFLRKALKARPDHPETTLALANALVLGNQNQAGVDLALLLIQEDKAFGPAYDFLFEQYQGAHRTQDSEDILKLKVANNPNRVDFLLALARYYAVTSKPAEMDSTLRRVLDHPADFPNSQLIVGDFYSSLGKLDEAARLYQEGLRGSPKDQSSYRKKLIRVLAAQRRFPEALRETDVIVKDSPGDPEAKLARALIWLQEGKPENLDPAIAELLAQIRLKQEDPVLHYQLGAALSRRNDPGGALREWTAAAEISRNYLPPRFALAALELSQGKPKEALQRSEEILEVDPGNADAQLLHAACLTGAGRLPEARASLDHLVSGSPQSLRARYQLGVLDISERKYGEAERIFLDLQRADASNPQMIEGLAEAYRGENQSGKAIQLLQDELKKSPNSQPLRNLLAHVASASGNPDLAIAQYKQMVLSDPTSVDLQIAMGQAYEAKGDYATAVLVFQKAAQTGPKSETAFLQLAGALLGTAGKTNEAKAAYRRALALQPDDPRALNNLAFLMLETGESADEALNIARRGLQFAEEPGLKASLEDTVGWAYLKKKMYDDAVQTFQALVKANVNGVVGDIFGTSTATPYTGLSVTGTLDITAIIGGVTSGAANITVQKPFSCGMIRPSPLWG